MPLPPQVGGQVVLGLFLFLQSEEGRVNEFVFVHQRRAREVFSFETVVRAVPD